MADPALEVAQALAPLLAAGADGALEEVAHQAGAGAADAVRRMIDRIHKRTAEDPGEEQTATALRDALEDGQLTEAELLEALKALRTIRVGDSYRVRGNAYVGNTIKVEGGGNFHG
jgi:hypothetical protein